MKRIYILLFLSVMVLGLKAQQEIRPFVFDAPYYDDGIASFEGPNKQTILFGNTSSYHSTQANPWMIIMDSNDKVILRKTFNNFPLNTEEISAVVKASYGNFILTGSVNINADYNVFIMAVTPSGNVLWSKNYGGADWDFAKGITQISGNNFVICGETFTQSAGGSDGFLLRINGQGDSLKYYQFGGADDESANAICYNHNQELVVSGYTKSYGVGSKDVFFLRTNQQLDSLHFTANFSQYNHEANDIIQTYDSNYVVVGYRTDSLGKSKDWMMKLDAMGNNLWNKKQSKLLDEGAYYAVFQNLPNRTFYAVGYSNYYGNGGKDVIVHRRNKNGYFETGATFGAVADDVAYHLRQDKNKILHLTGYTENYNVVLNGMYYLRMDSNFQMTNPAPKLFSVGIQQDEITTSAIKVYPNPAQDHVWITLPSKLQGAIHVQLIDMKGQVVYELIQYDGGQQIHLILPVLNAGIYLLRVQNEQQQFSKKISIK